MPQRTPCDVRLKRLPHTLYNATRVTATSYSKVSRGLRFPQEISGLPTRRKCSEGCSWGQWRPHCALHARHQSNDKALRSHLLLSLHSQVLTTILWRALISSRLLASLQGSDCIFILMRMSGVQSLRILDTLGGLVCSSSPKCERYFPSPLESSVRAYSSVRLLLQTF